MGEALNICSEPRRKVLHVIACTADGIVHHGILEAGAHFPRKPFNLRDLAVKVRQAIGE